MSNAGHRERLRERFLKEGLDSFQEHEILELILFQSIPQKNVNNLAHQLIDKFGSLSGVLDAPKEALEKELGISSKTATNLVMLKEVLFKYRESKSKKIDFCNLNQVASHVIETFRDEPSERMVVLYLSSRNALLCKKQYRAVDGFSLNASIREIVKDCINLNASSVYIAHNHPDFVANPSTNDLKFTKRLYYSLQSIRSLLADHLIVGGDGTMFSFWESGLIFAYQKEYSIVFSQVQQPQQDTAKIEKEVEAVVRGVENAEKRTLSSKKFETF